MDEETPSEPIDNNDSINERDEANSPPQLTVLTTVAYDYTDLPGPKSFDRMDIDNHNVEYDDSNHVSSTTESTVYQLPKESAEQVSNEPKESASAVENDTSTCLKSEPESPSTLDTIPVLPRSPKTEPKSPSKSDNCSVSQTIVPGKSRYGRVRKQKLSTDFVSVDRKSFAVLNSNSYEPTISDSLDTLPKKEKPKRAYRRKLKYVVEGQSIIASKECADESIDSDIEFRKTDDETSRSSLNTSAIKTYSRKGDFTDEKQTTVSDNKIVTVTFPGLNWKVGDIAWAKIGCYPYWPSIVTLESGSSIYVKPVGKQQSRLAVHVHFFGDKGRRSWVLTTSLMKYESKEQFMELKRQYCKDKLRMRYFIIPPRIEDLWEKAVNEADTILKLPIDERTQYYQNLYPITQEICKSESADASKVKSSPKKLTDGAKRRGRKRKIVDDDKSEDHVESKKVKLESESPKKSLTDDQKEKKEREPADEHTKKRRAFMRRMNQILKQSNAASLPPKKRIKLQAKNEQEFNKLLDSTTTTPQKKQPRADDSFPSQAQAHSSCSSLESRKNDLSVYDFESDEETDVFIGTYNSKFTPQILNKIEERVDLVEEKPKVLSPNELPIPSAPSSSACTTPLAEQHEVAAPNLDPKESETPETSVLKRKVGRPKGSKNKIKAQLVLKRRGRPPGKKNKSKTVSSEEPEAVTDSTTSQVQQQAVQLLEMKAETKLPENVEKVKTKRGRPRKTEQPPKRGRPRKKEPPLKRGRERPPLGLKNKIKSVTALQHKQNKLLLMAPVPTTTTTKLFKRPRGRPRKNPIPVDGVPDQVTKDSSLSAVIVPGGETVATESETKRRVPERPRKSTSDYNPSILTADLSSEEDDGKSEEEKHSLPLYRSKKATNIFLGLKNEKVCQVCLKPGDTIRCRGPCCGYFHVECDAKIESIENEAESAKPRRGRKRKSTGISLVKVKIEANDDTEADSKTKDAVNDDGSSLNSEATPKTDADENGLPDTVASSKTEVAEETSASHDAGTIDLTNPEIIETDRVTSTNTMVNGGTDSKAEITAKDENETTATKQVNGELQLGEQESAENEISSSTGEKLNNKTSTNGKVNGVACNDNEETCSSDASAESSNVGGRTNNGNGVEFYCKRCSEERLYPCFSCGKEIQDKTKETLRYTCYVVACGRTYHKECLKEWPQASWGTSSSIKESLRCPQHYCHTCNSENPSVRNKHSNEILVRCIKCPTSYHKRVHCIPAGTEVLSSSQIICPRHYEPPPGMKHAHLNATWCFICCIGGSLICCDECPMSFHVECLKLRPEEYEGRYICDDCQTGRYILYGEIAWVKLGHYRWWPARVLFPFEIPENIQNLPHRRGEFVVQFFGSHDYNWVNRGRAFLYQEGDSGKKYCKRNSVDMSFEKAMTEAEEAYKELQLDKAARDEVSRLGLKPPRYVKIKANRPIGNVKILEADKSNLTACECDPKSEKPCAADSDCLNRMLLVECNPLVCKAGERCMNQVFEKREYPPLMPYKTDKRGWGLKTLVDMKKGDFIIEYVGEMIDEDEYKRRVDIMHKKQEDNYYFLTIDNQRMLDAGPKGNVSRFMNHSCDPNCETQKWTVNGDTRIGLFAVKDIPANSELVFNYNLSTQGNEKRACLCGSFNCSGYIGVKAVKNGNSSTDEESRKKSGDDMRKRSAAEAGSSATNNPNAKQRRTKKFKKMKRLRHLKPGTGKLAAAKLTTDLRMKMKMKNRVAASAMKTGLETSGEKLQNELSGKTDGKSDVSKKAQTSIVRFKKGHVQLGGRTAKHRFRAQECSLLKSNTAVGTFSCPQIEEFFKQRDFFKKDPSNLTTPANKGDDEPYIERRGRKKTPKDDDEKKELFFKILKRRVEQKIKNMTVSEVDDKCFKCGAHGELLYCDNNSCPRGYHLPCVNKTRWPTGRWLCPWHYCTICSSRSRIIRCDVCVNAYCGSHHKENIFEECEDKYSCKTHKSEGAIQAYFKSVAMMRLFPVKAENGDESTELINPFNDKTADAKNLILLADVIEKASEASRCVTNFTDTMENEPNEPEKTRTVVGKRKLSIQKVDANVPSVSDKPSNKKTSSASNGLEDKDTNQPGDETNVVEKKIRKISSSDITTKTSGTRRISRTEGRANAEKIQETSRPEIDANTAKPKRKRSSRFETETNEVAKKIRKVSRVENETKGVENELRKISKSESTTNVAADKPKKTVKSENRTKVVKKLGKVLKPRTSETKVVAEKTKRISKVEDTSNAISRRAKKDETNAVAEKMKNDETNAGVGAGKTTSRTGDETKTVAENSKKISRTARKSIRSCTTRTPTLLQSDGVDAPQTAATESSTSTDNVDLVAETEEPTSAYGSDDEFVDVEVEVLNDSD